MKFRDLLTGTLVVAFFALTLLSLGCSQQRDTQGGTPTTAQNGVAAYSYPHSPNWQVDHVGFYAKYGKQVQGTGSDCVRCHNDKSGHLGAPKNLNCAITCHTPTKAPGGSAPVSVPQISSDGQSCIQCHQDHFNRAQPHFPAAAGLCSTCHIASPNHATDKTKATVAPVIKGNDSCLRCHSRMDTMSEVHKPLKSVGCVYCHDAHGSDQKFFKTMALPDLCLDCHGEKMDDTAKSVHGIIKVTASNQKSCLNCHNPHSADIKPLLLQEPKTLCISCHDREYQTTFADGSPRVIPNIKAKITGPFTHRPAKNVAQCTNCHSPHSTPNDAILNLPYPMTPTAPYVAKAEKVPGTYALCLDCHDDSTLNKTPSVDDTSFRIDTTGADGKVTMQNLHWTHVVDKGQSCFACHDPHGSMQAHNIKPTFRVSSTMNANTNYTATATGGTCATSCHANGVKKYDRAQ